MTINSINMSLMNRLCTYTNEAAFRLTGERCSCIAASAGLTDVLNELGVSARVLRVRAAVHAPPDAPHTHYSCVLGFDGDGIRLPPAGPGMWHGHLVVIAAEQFLLDPTLDQVNDKNPWLKAEPFTGQIDDAFLSGTSGYMAPIGDTGSTVSYRAFPGRGGYQSAGAFRKRARDEMAHEILLTIARQVLRLLD